MMMTPEELRTQAEKFDRLAAQAHDPLAAGDFQDLARQWREMAGQVEKLAQKRADPSSSGAEERRILHTLKPANRTASSRSRDLEIAVPKEVAVRHLAEAERHIEDGGRCLTMLRSAIKKLDDIGRDATSSAALLATIEEIQNAFVLHRELVLRELQPQDGRSLLAKSFADQRGPGHDCDDV